ncbi:MAG TPA: HAMP domain-containing sensor histidine kinase [Tepidisphaeraceae bacterium]|nr:HAMP domain-containing sensor histidine kinase [Tepidisphaeraceae bacterium]
MPLNRFQLAMIRYAMAVFAVGLAAVLTHGLADVGDTGISPLFFLAVLFSAWYGGLGPGLVATLLSGAATAYLLLTPEAATFAVIRDHLLRVAVFTIVSLLTSSLHGAIKRAAEESRKARQAAESANAAKTRFLAMVSHELRTPLSPVLMVAEMLEQDPALSPRARKDVGIIRRNVDLEIRLIEDLVDLTRISAGKMCLREESVDIHQPLQAAVHVCEADLRDKNIELILRMEATTPRLTGDPVRLQQIFWNLLRNAVKFTPPGGRIEISTRNTGPGEILVQIADTGIGIDPTRLSSVFDAFEQGSHIQMRFGGLGLGLAICKALVEAHHGSVRAISRGKDLGATFIVTLPTAPSFETTTPRDVGVRAATGPLRRKPAQISKVL